MAPKKALLKARKRHELSSGIIRSNNVESCEGNGTSGGSLAAVLALRVNESGVLGFVDAVVELVFGGARPTSANEKDDGCDPLVDG